MGSTLGWMVDADRLRYGVCWWCGEPHSLFRLVGASLAGSEPLGVPDVLREPIADFRVCPKCATTFGRARIAHDLELGEIPLRPAPPLAQREIDAAARDVNRRVWSRIRKAIEEERRAEGG